MKEIFKDGFLMSGKAVLINLLCFFVVISFVVLGSALFSESVGYNAIGTKDEKSEALYTHYFEDGEDTRLAEYEAKGYEIEKQDLKLMPEGKNNGVIAVAQLFALAIFISFTYPKLWDKGYKDRNMVITGNQQADPLKGLKIGLVAIIIPEAIILAASLIKTISAQLLKFVFPVFYTAIDFITRDSGKLADLQLWKLVLIMMIFLIVPLVTYVSYILGYKDFSIGEKLIYKKRK